MAVAEKILPVMDAVDAAMKISPDDEGIKTMARALESAFEQIGIVRIKSVGEILNPMYHNAIQVIDVPDTPTNTVDFINRLIKYFGYKPKEIQTDNGLEFTYNKSKIHKIILII